MLWFKKREIPKPPRPKREFRPNGILIASDLHRGARISAMPEYEKELCDEMGQFGHVVLNGDIFELSYVDAKYYGYDPKEVGAHIIRHAIASSAEFFDRFLTEHPSTTLHFVLGNHENVTEFRDALAELSKKHKNFEWSPEAIRIGDALFVHGDLPMAGTTDKTRHISTPEEAAEDMRQGKWWAFIDDLGQKFVDWARRPELTPSMVHQWLVQHDGKGSLTYSHNGTPNPFEMGWVKNVFFGHTHMRFDNREHEGILYHNSGALTHAVLRKREHGMMQAEFDGNSVTNVRPLFSLSTDIGRDHARRAELGIR